MLTNSLQCYQIKSLSEMWKLAPMWTSSKPLKVCYLKTSTHKTEEEESCTPTLAPCRNCNVSLRRFLLKCEVLFVSETHYWECERVRKWGLVVNWQATPVNAISWQNVIHWHSCYVSYFVLSLLSFVGYQLPPVVTYQLVAICSVLY